MESWTYACLVVGLLLVVAPAGALVPEGLDEFQEESVDHAASYRIANIWYESEVTVGEKTGITVQLVDEHGDPVDGQEDAVEVTFAVGSVSGDARFLNGTDEVTEVVRPVDATGNATVTLRTDRYATTGSYWVENLVWISPPTTDQGRCITIRGTANGVPCAIEASVSPSVQPVPYVPADGSAVFILSYALFDQYGNPCGNREIQLDTGTGEGRTVTTSSLGRAVIEFGPSSVEKNVTMTATAVDNASVTTATPLLFYDPSPTAMHLSASPQNMPSADVGSEHAVAEVRAKVVDKYGNPVADQNVRFEINISSINVDSEQTDPPYLSTKGLNATSAKTNAHGVASVKFFPGAFADESENRPMATGSCDVVATWNDIEDSVNLTWKNYPYLSVETNASSDKVTVNDTVDVTLRLIGDGWELERLLPIDVVFCLDRGEGMLVDDGKDKDDRMIYAREAVADFTENISSFGEANRVGLVTYGDITTGEGSPFEDGLANLTQIDKKIDKSSNSGNYNWVKYVGVDNKHDTKDYIINQGRYPGNGEIKYEDFAEVWVRLGDHRLEDPQISYSKCGDNNMSESLSLQVPLKRNDLGFGNPSAPLRKGLHTSIKELAGNSRDNTVKAIVVLMQTEYRYFGDPFAEGSPLEVLPDWETIEKNTENYYAFKDGGSENMAERACQNDIIIYTILYTWSDSNPEKEVAEKLANQTGGISLDAANSSELNKRLAEIAEDLKRHAGINTTVDLNFEDVLVNDVAYQYNGSDVFEYVYEDKASTLIRLYHSNNKTDIIPAYTRNDSLNWTENALHFDVGTIELGQTWEATFRLKPKMAGNIRIFGDDSSEVLFDDNNERVFVPPLYIGASLPDAMGDLTGTLQIRNLHCVPPENASNSVILSWNRLYDGTRVATEMVEYSTDGNTWVPFYEMDGGPGEVGRTATLDLRSFPEGQYTLKLRVRAIAPDAPLAEESIDISVNRPHAFIKIS